MSYRHFTPTLIIMAALYFATLACSLAPTPTATPNLTPAPTETWKCNRATLKASLTKKDDGRLISLKKNETLLITLASNPTTGFQWTLEPYDGTLFFGVEKNYASSSSAIGSGGSETFCFTASKSGQTLLTLNYHRPFETNKPPLEIFRINLEITD